MKTENLHPIIWVRAIQGNVIKEIANLEDLQKLMKDNNLSKVNDISDYLKTNTKIKIDGENYTVKNFRVFLINSEHLKYNEVFYNFSLDILVE
jgi:hypothetical protein